MRLIDADYVKSKLNKSALGGHLHYYVCGVIDDAPTIDEGELVARLSELEEENARLEEAFQKATGVIAATDCVECKNKVYRKAYNDVMKIRANIQEIIEDVRKNNGGADNE